MAGRILAYLLLVLVAIWLVLSYVPASIIPLPQVSARMESTWFGPVALLILVGMAAIQVALLTATGRVMRRYNDHRSTTPAADKRFHLKLNQELFWTLVPLLMVFALGLLSFSIWSLAWL